MGMLVKKKQILTATLIIALAAAVGVNWYYSTPNKASSDESTVYEQQVSGNLGDSLLVAGKVQTQEGETTNAQDDETTAAESGDENYFAEARLKRTKAHDEIVNEIEGILKNESLTQEDKNKILVMLSQYQNNTKAEADIESLIAAKTGGDCVVIINDNNAQVILQKNTLNDSILLQITEIVEKNTNISAENLTIIEAK